MSSTEYLFALRERLGAQAATALAEVLDSHQSETVTLAIQSFDRRLGEECTKLRTEMSGLRSDLSFQMNGLRMELRTEFANVRAELLKWSFVSWIGQFAAIALYISLIR